MELRYEELDKIYQIDFEKRIITLTKDEKGCLRTSLNTQQLYNWHVHKLSENMWANVSIIGSGFIGLQPVIKFDNQLKIVIPTVKEFVVNGIISTSEEGEFPFIVEPETSLIMSQYSRPHAKVFLSHSSKDKPFVRELRQGLYPICETFFDETDIQYGQSITTRLNDELESSDILALVFSENSAQSEWVKKEWAGMMHMNKKILIIKIDEQELPPLLKDIKYISATTKSVQEVCEAISSVLG